MVLVHNSNPERWTMCGKLNPDLHHKLTRARGGGELDKLGETYHHMYLCREHHGYAHDSNLGIAGGLLLEGYFMNGVYVGPDEYLSTKYGEPPC